MTLPPLTEAHFMDQVTDLAALFGWDWAHFRPAQTLRGWRTPVSGPLGKGFPDLVLVRGSRLLFAELKRDGAKLTFDQARIHALLLPAADCYVWRPQDWDFIETVLR